MTAVFILYDWDFNAILPTFITDTKDEPMVKSFKDNVKYFNKRGFNPKFNIVDNMASKSVQDYLEDRNIVIQPVEPHNHRDNESGRSVHTYKNHSIAGLCSCNDNFPTIMWRKLIRQYQDSLNMLRTSRVLPKVSVYHALEGPHYFNQIIFAPPVTRATILTPPERRYSLGSRALDAWYIRPEYHHC